MGLEAVRKGFKINKNVKHSKYNDNIIKKSSLLLKLNLRLAYLSQI